MRRRTDKGAQFQTNITNKGSRFACEEGEIDALLAEVLCIFAARGRAIREERTKPQGEDATNGALPSHLDAKGREPSEEQINVEQPGCEPNLTKQKYYVDFQNV